MTNELPPIVFVLGAGASWPCGFPLGTDLVRSIMNRTDLDALLDEVGVKDRFKELQKALRMVGNQSIDDLLRNRHDLRDAGIVAIAYALLSLESADNLIPHTGDNSIRANDRWYPTLFAYLRKVAPDWRSFEDLPITFITFNYDRSFDTYWANALEAQFGASGRGLQAYLDFRPVIHIHGQLGPLPWQVAYSEGAIPLGTLPTPSVLKRVMYWVRTPYDTHRDDTYALVRAQKAIRAASAVFFIGFAFDRRNFDKLGWPAEKAPHLLYSHFTKDDEERRRVREDIFNHHSAFVGGQDDMSKAFLDKAWAHYSRGLAKEWSRPLS